MDQTVHYLFCLLLAFVHTVCTTKHMVQLNYNFTHAWQSMCGYMQIFACKIQKFPMEILIFTRHGVARDLYYIPLDMNCCKT